MEGVYQDLLKETEDLQHQLKKEADRWEALHSLCINSLSTLVSYVRRPHLHHKAEIILFALARLRGLSWWLVMRFLLQEKAGSENRPYLRPEKQDQAYKSRIEGMFGYARYL